MAPGSCVKRTFGVDFDYESSVERADNTAKLEQQLDGLRALLPNSARRRERVDPSVVMDAYRYIAILQQQVQDLSSELLECEGLDSCDDQEQSLSHRNKISDQEPAVDVMRRDGVMEVRILCANRPGLLVDVMEAVESRGLTVTHVRIACHGDSDVKCFSLEKEESSATISLTTEGGSEGADEEDLESVRAMFVDAICEGGCSRQID